MTHRRLLPLTLLLGCLPATALAEALAEPAAAAAPAPDTLLRRYEVGGFAGAKRDHYGFRGGAWGDTFFLTGGTFAGALGSFGFDGNVHGLATPEPGGSRPALIGAVRLGFAGERLDVRAGAVLQVTNSAALHWVPSLHGRYAIDDRYALSAGLFDGLGYAPGHLSFDVGPFSVGYVGLLGVRAAARLPVSETLSLQLDGFAFSLGGYQSFMVTLSTLVSNVSSKGAL